MLVAAIADGRLPLYLGMGMVATVNPCGFAMLPAYLSYFLGTEEDDASPLRAIGVALAVSTGFVAVFATAGLLVEVASLEQVFDFAPWISIVIGVALLGLGIAMVAGFELVVRLPKLERGGRARTVQSMFVFGVSYAVASIGCSLPIFLSAVAGTMERESVADGVVVFATYAAGMALVLAALTVTMALARTSVLRFLRSAMPYVNRVAGTLVALAGVYVILYGVLELRTYRAKGGQVPSSGVTDVVTGWSADISQWINDTGAVRIAVLLVAGLVAVTVITARRARPKTSE